MESADVFPRGLTPAQCPDLMSLYDSDGPFISCHFDTEASTEDATHRLEIRWKDLRRELEVQGAAGASMGGAAGASRGAGAGASRRELEVQGAAGASTGAAGASTGAGDAWTGATEASLGAVEHVVSGARQLGESVSVIAANGRTLLVEAYDRPLGYDVARLSPLPALAPIIMRRQQQIRYVLVACDHAGADITVRGPDGELEQTVGEDRHDPELHKVPTGGWSHKRYQQRVENAWERNARQVLEVVDRLIVEVKPRLVLYGGEPQACGLIEQGAAKALKGKLQRISLSRAADGSDEHDANEIHRAVATAVAADTARLLAHLREMKAKSLGVEGAARTLDALAKAQVETLLVHDDPADERTAYFSLNPLVVGGIPGPVSASGAQPRRARLVEVVIAAALLSGAGVRVVPGNAINGGVGALLRFA